MDWRTDDLYIELTKFDYHLCELYEYSVKELLFILKYKREGIAYDIWRRGTVHRAAVWGKDYPKVEKMLPELFEKELKVPVFISESPLTCVAEGCGIMLSNLDLIDK